MQQCLFALSLLSSVSAGACGPAGQNQPGLHHHRGGRPGPRVPLPRCAECACMAAPPAGSCLQPTLSGWGYVCLSVAAATLASLAGNETAAGFIMHAPGDSVAKAVLTLLEVCTHVTRTHLTTMVAHEPLAAVSVSVMLAVYICWPPKRVLCLCAAGGRRARLQQCRCALFFSGTAMPPCLARPLKQPTVQHDRVAVCCCCRSCACCCKHLPGIPCLSPSGGKGRHLPVGPLQGEAAVSGGAGCAAQGGTHVSQ